MNKKCYFCANKEHIILETKQYYARFDGHPISLGHALIIPKKHRISIMDLSKDEWVELQHVIKKTMKIIEKTNYEQTYTRILEDEKLINPMFCKKMLKNKNINKKPDGYNIGVNEGETAGRTIHHLHIHIIPRYKGDVKNPIGGIRNIIPKLGNYKK